MFDRKRKATVYIDVSKIPDGWTIDQILDLYDKKNIVLFDENKKNDKKSKQELGFIKTEDD